MATKVNRPGIVLLLGILGVISGAFKMFTGLVVALQSDTSELLKTTSLDSTGVIWAGVALMLIGAATIFIATSLLSGQRWTQVWYGVLATFGMVYGLWSIFAQNGVSVWTGLLTLVFNFVILQLLFNEKAQAFFDEK